MRPRARGTWSRPSRSRRRAGRRPAIPRGRAARRGGSRTPSAARDLAPRLSLPRIGLARQPEHALAEHVLVDLGGPALDRVGATAQHPAQLERQRLGVAGGVALPRHGVHAEEADRERLDALVQLPLVHLADRALGPRRTPGPQSGAHPVVRLGSVSFLAVAAYE